MMKEFIKETIKGVSIQSVEWYCGILTLWILVYSSLFSSSLSKMMQFSSKKLIIGVFHLGERKKFMMMSKNQS